MKRDNWIKCRNKSLRKNINYQKQESTQFFCLWYTPLKILKIVWYKDNLTITSSVGFGHPVKYSYEIPHEYSSEWGNISRKFFSNGDFLSPICCDFFRSFVFGESTLFHFNTTVTFSEQLFLEQLHFLRSSFFKTAIFFKAVIFSRIITFSERKLLLQVATFWK